GAMPAAKAIARDTRANVTEGAAPPEHATCTGPEARPRRTPVAASRPVVDIVQASMMVRLIDSCAVVDPACASPPPAAASSIAARRRIPSWRAAFIPTPLPRTSGAMLRLQDVAGSPVAYVCVDVPMDRAAKTSFRIVAAQHDR